MRTSLALLGALALGACGGEAPKPAPAPDDFWSLISESRRVIDPKTAKGNMDRQAKRWMELLRGRSAEEVLAFDRIFEELSIRAYRWELWGAAYVIEGGCSDDSFTDFRAWLISMGRDVYEKALADPESLAEAASAPHVESTFFEEFGYLTSKVYAEKTGGKRPEHAGLNHPKKPAGVEWKEDEAELKRLYPKLWARFGDK